MFLDFKKRNNAIADAMLKRVRLMPDTHTAPGKPNDKNARYVKIALKAK